MNEAAFLTIQLTLIVVFVLFSLYVLVKIFRLAFRWIYWSVNQSQANATINLICFAIAAYLYPRPLSFIVSRGWDIILALVTQLPSLIQQQVPAFQSICRGGTPESCLATISTSFWALWTVFLTNVFQRLDLGQFPLNDAILFTAIWLALANVINWAIIAQHLAGVAQSLVPFAANTYRSMSPALRSNICFFAILALGSYLSFSSVIAIPSLQEADTQDRLKSEQLKVQLTTVVLKDADFNTRFPKVASQALSEVSAVRPVAASPPPVLIDSQKRDTPSNAPAAPNTPATPPWLMLLARNSDNKVVELTNALGNLRENFRSKQYKLIDVATETFDLSNRGRKGIRESQQHFLNVELWYRRWWAQQAGQIGECRTAIDRYASQARATLDSIIALTDQLQSLPVSFPNEGFKRLSQLETDAYHVCQSQPTTYDIPDRADFGGYLGVFGIAASWLLKTESISLVLIAGLLGFGLLGAACSTFIRNVNTRSPGDPLVPQLPSVIIRGGSAAVLIFLGVYAGLAVFAGTNANPNPYAVLFTCLVAAAFSEDAWTWGANQFRSRLAGAGNGSSAAQSGGQAQGSAQTP